MVTSDLEKKGYAARRRGRQPGVSYFEVMEDVAMKPEPDARQRERMKTARTLLLQADAGEPVGLRRAEGMLRHEAARVLAIYGHDSDERLAAKYLPYDERKHLLAVRRRRYAR